MPPTEVEVEYNKNNNRKEEKEEEDNSSNWKQLLLYSSRKQDKLLLARAFLLAHKRCRLAAKGGRRLGIRCSEKFTGILVGLGKI